MFSSHFRNRFKIALVKNQINVKISEQKNLFGQTVANENRRKMFKKEHFDSAQALLVKIRRKNKPFSFCEN